MTLWLVFSLMTAAAIFAVLWPLGRRKPLRRGSDIAVYRDQLDEIVRDRSAGLIGEAEAEAARVEVSRRLIAAADAAAAETPAPEAPARWRRRATAIAALILLPAGAVLLYLMLGSPQLPGEPLAARLNTPNENHAIENLIAQVENHVERNPDDGRAWEVLAPVYMRLSRYDDAVRAWRNAIRLNGSSASREADLGEALVFAANGVVTAEAKSQFDRAFALDAQDVMANFYLGMAADQDGRRADAEKIWRDLLARAPPGAPWVELVRHSLDRTAPAGTATASATPGGSGAPPADHDVNAMVERLANRLKKDGSDAQGWVQLVRSYRALGEFDKAQAAVADARRALANDPDKLRQFAEGSEGAAPTAPTAQAAPPMAPAAPPTAPAAGAPGPNAADIAAAAQMKPDEQNQMIRSMVARLADKLKQDGSDLDGWQRLLRAYMVLGERDKAHAAAADARRALASDPDKLRRLDEVIKDLGVEG
jgi:cytochrome c-type biogenesis protein CcmH